jgi:hypothetical protein
VEGARPPSESVEILGKDKSTAAQRSAAAALYVFLPCMGLGCGRFITCPLYVLQRAAEQ